MSVRDPDASDAGLRRWGAWAPTPGSSLRKGGGVQGRTRTGGLGAGPVPRVLRGLCATEAVAAWAVPRGSDGRCAPWGWGASSPAPRSPCGTLSLRLLWWGAEVCQSPPPSPPKGTAPTDSGQGVLDRGTPFGCAAAGAEGPRGRPANGRCPGDRHRVWASEGGRGARRCRPSLRPAPPGSSSFACAPPPPGPGLPQPFRGRLSCQRQSVCLSPWPLRVMPNSPPPPLFCHIFRGSCPKPLGVRILHVPSRLRLMSQRTHVEGECGRKKRKAEAAPPVRRCRSVGRPIPLP